MKRILILIVTLAAVMGLAACGPTEAEQQHPEQDKQHHLYNIGICPAETNEAHSALTTLNSWVDGTPEGKQRQHDYRAAECMAHAEHTTIKFQLDTYDSYGKVAGAAQ